MLKKFRLHNFRTFLNAELQLTRSHLLIGRNNSGKTNLCSALQFFARTSVLELANAAAHVPGRIFEMKNWTTSSDQIEFTAICELDFESEVLEYTYRLQLTVNTATQGMAAAPPSLSVAHEELTVRGRGFRNVVLLESDGREAQLLHEERHLEQRSDAIVRTLVPRDATMLCKLYELNTNRRATLFRRYLSHWASFSLSPAAMRSGWQASASGITALLSLGENLATVLYQTKNIDEQRYRRVLDHVRSIEPGLEAINFIPTPDQGAVPFVALQNRPRATWEGLSDGTLRYLALAYIAETVATFASTDQEGTPPLVNIEEPENGIYPGLMRTLFELFEERAGNGQFLFTSHSPYFINLFDGSRESVTLLRRDNDHTTFVTPPPAGRDPDRLLLAEQYSMELFE